MRKPIRLFFVAFALLSLSMLFVSCNGDAASSSLNGQDGNHLVVISDVSSIGREGGKGVAIGDPIIDVLLKFHREGTYSSESKVKFENPFAFYLEMLSSEGSNGDGMKFNYVLYVPDCIQDVYTICGGVNPTSGNPFWWYMLTYYGKSLNDVRGDWEKTLNLLLDNRNWLFFPMQSDYVPDWSHRTKGQTASLVFVSSSDELDKPINGFMLKTNTAVKNVRPSANPYAFYGRYLDTPEKRANGDEYNFILYYPSSIQEAYAEGNGKSPNTGNPFWWYLKKYYECRIDDFSANPEEIIKQLFTGEGDMLKKPNPKDVTGDWVATDSK